MKKLLVLLILLTMTSVRATAAEMEFKAPPVPDIGAEFLEEQPDSLTEGFLSICEEALPYIYPALTEGVSVCVKVIGIMLILSVLENFVGLQMNTICLAGTLAVATALLTVSRALIPLGKETVQELSSYGKLLLPVMTGALAAQGKPTASGALYAGTALFNSLLTGMINRLLLPSVYIFLAISVASAALRDSFIGKLKGIIKSTVIWLLKILLYVFTGYMTISGVVSGTTDAMAMKAAKVTISGVVPVVGGILADASEAVLVGAAVMKNAAGIYGILAVIAIAVGPFIRLGVQYLLIKITGAICSAFGSKPLCGLIDDVCAAMGLVLAMTAAVGLMLLISTVCFMRVTV